MHGIGAYSRPHCADITASLTDELPKSNRPVRLWHGLLHHCTSDKAAVTLVASLNIVTGSRSNDSPPAAKLNIVTSPALAPQRCALVRKCSRTSHNEDTCLRMLKMSTDGKVRYNHAAHVWNVVTLAVLSSMQRRRKYNHYKVRMYDRLLP